MASGVLGGNEVREKKRRWEESNKVYARKNHKKFKNSHHAPLPHQTLTSKDNNSSSPPSQLPRTSEVVASDDSSSQSHPQSVLHNARELANGNAFSRYTRIVLNLMRRSEVNVSLKVLIPINWLINPRIFT